MTYAHPFFVLFALLGFIFWAMGHFKILKPAQIYLPLRKEQKKKGWIHMSGFFLGALAWALLGYAMMQPRRPLGFAKNKIEVSDIFFVVDVSFSMKAQDFQPNRLEAAKKKILEFIELRPKDRIGIIIFAHSPFTLLPLSTDLELIKKMVSQIKLGFLGASTNIGDALGLAVVRATKSLAKNKVIILLTDGVSMVGKMTPVQAAHESKSKGIKVYTIGIGRDHTPIKLSGRYQSIPGGSIDLETLRTISEITGGKSFYAENIGALKKVFSDIQKMEKTEIDSHNKVIYEELYHKFLLAGVLLLLFVEWAKRWALREAI